MKTKITITLMTTVPWQFKYKDKDKESKGKLFRFSTSIVVKLYWHLPSSIDDMLPYEMSSHEI